MKLFTQRNQFFVIFYLTFYSNFPCCPMAHLCCVTKMCLMLSNCRYVYWHICPRTNLILNTQFIEHDLELYSKSSKVVHEAFWFSHKHITDKGGRRGWRDFRTPIRVVRKSIQNCNLESYLLLYGLVLWYHLTFEELMNQKSNFSPMHLVSKDNNFIILQLPTLQIDF